MEGGEKMAGETVLQKSVDQALLEEIEASIKQFDHKMCVAYDKQSELKERKQLLELAKTKTNSGMAKTIIENMVDEIQEELSQLEELARISKNNKKYHQEVFEALDEAIKSR